MRSDPRHRAGGRGWSVGAGVEPYAVLRGVVKPLIPATQESVVPAANIGAAFGLPLGGNGFRFLLRGIPIDSDGTTDVPLDGLRRATHSVSFRLTHNRSIADSERFVKSHSVAARPGATLPPDIIAVSGPNFKRGRLLLSGDSAIISRGTPFRAPFPLTKGTESAMLGGYRQVGAKGLDFPNGICYAMGGWTRRRGVFRCHGGRPDAD